MHSNIFLTGFSGTGKSVVGKLVASALGWRYVDTDEEIVNRAGKPIADIFSKEGEGHFRELELRMLKEVCQRKNQVVSTGGGMVVSELNRELMKSNGMVICLEATPETIYKRLVNEMENEQEPVVRPLLSGPDPMEHIRSLKAQRQDIYGDCHWTIRTDYLTETEVCSEVIRGWQVVGSRLSKAHRQDPDLAAVVNTSNDNCPIYVGYDILDTVGRRVKDSIGIEGAYLVTDENVYRKGRRVQVSLEASGIPTHTFIMPLGEQNKSLGMADRIYQWLTGLKAERRHLIVAVGGGVVGDLAGFVAATFLRGMPFVQVPTSLAAMVDASIGGKVAVNLPQGKNLVGAFHQPRFVLADVGVLETLPKRELLSGWAEAIKHGLILDRELLETFEQYADAILALEPEITTRVIRRSMAVKAQVVSQDEKETLGLRMLLNYGHTIGHALETATGYEGLLHGEAVSIGMMGAAQISNKMGLLSSDDVERQSRLLERFGLPLSCPETDLNQINDAMLLDKKTRGKSIRWVLLEDIGSAVVRADIPTPIVQEALYNLTQQ